MKMVMALVVLFVAVVFPQIAGAQDFTRIRGTECAAIAAVDAAHPTCSEWTGLATCLGAVAAVANNANVCSLAAQRATTASGHAATACGRMSTELTRVNAALEACRNPPARRTPGSGGQIALPACIDEGEGVGLHCSTRERVILAGAACRSARASLTAAWCACPEGSRADLVGRGRTNTGAILARGYVCFVRIGGRAIATTPNNVEQRLTDLENEMTDNNARWAAICDVELASVEGQAVRRINCDRLRDRLAGLNAGAAAGETPDFATFRTDLTALGERLARLEATVERHTAEIGVLQSDVVSLRATSGNTVGGAAPTFRLRPFAGMEIGRLAGMVTTTGFVGGAQGRISLSNVVDIHLTIGVLGGRFASRQIESSLGWLGGAGLGFRLRILGQPATIDVGFMARMYNDTGVRRGENVEQAGRFGDFLGASYGGQLTFGVDLYRGFGVMAWGSAGWGKALVGTDVPNRFLDVSGFSGQGGFALGYNF